MKNLFRGVLMALAFVSANVLAGATEPQPVVIDTEGRTAQGDMVTARTADNLLEDIGCGIRVFDIDPVVKLGFCQAREASGQIATCITENPEMVDVIASLNDASFISFSWNDSSFCTRIGVSTQSWYLPKSDKGNK